MDILAYTKNVKTFKEQDILQSLLQIQVSAQDLSNNLDSLKANNLDLTATADRWIVSRGIKKHFESQGYRNSTLIENIQYGLSVLVSLNPEVTKLVKGYSEKLWDGKLITLRQTNILNLIEYMNFWLRYSQMLLEVLITMHNDGTDPERYLSKVDTRFINGTEQLYRSFSSDLMKGARNLIQNLSKIPDIELSESSLDVLEGTDGKGSVDLLQKGFGVHLINPYFWIALGYSKIQLWRIENMRRKNEMFAMKISQAINKRNGSPDPHLDHQIEVLQEAIIKHENKIQEIEADYA